MFPAPGQASLENNWARSLLTGDQERDEYLQQQTLESVRRRGGDGFGCRRGGRRERGKKRDGGCLGRGRRRGRGNAFIGSERGHKRMIRRDGPGACCRGGDEQKRKWMVRIRLGGTTIR